MVESRLKGEAASFLVGKFWAAAATGELDPEIFQNGESILANGIARVGETDRDWDGVRLAPFVERTDLFGDVKGGLVCYPLVVPRVIANLEPILVQLGDLVPRHVVPLVGGHIEPFGDEECRPELKLLEQRAGD